MTEKEADLVIDSLWSFINEIRHLKVEKTLKNKCECEDNDKCSCYMVKAKHKFLGDFEVSEIDRVIDFGNFILAAYQDKIYEDFQKGLGS